METMETELVNALWVGPCVAELPDRSVLIPGETTREIPREEAEGSENWRPLEEPKPAAAVAKTEKASS